MAEKLVAAQDGVPGIKIWNTSDWSLDSIAYAASNSVKGCRFSVDNNNILIAYDYSPFAILYDSPSWSRNMSLENPSAGQGTGIGFSPNGSWAVYTSVNSPYADVYEVSTWQKRPALSTSPGTICRIGVFSQDSGYMALGKGSGTPIALYDTSDWSRMTDPTGAGQNVYGLEFSRNDAMLGVASAVVPYVTIINTSTWTQLAQPTTQPSSIAVDVSFNHDNSLMAVAHYNSPYLTIYDTSDWSTITGPSEMPTANGNSCRFNTDGSLLAFGYAGGSYINVYNTSDWSKVAHANLTAGAGVWDVAFTTEAVTPPTGATQNAIFHGFNF